MIHYDENGNIERISQYWSRGDIESRMEALEVEPTDDLVDMVLGHLDRQFDASIGINWEVIDTHITMNAGES